MEPFTRRDKFNEQESLQARDQFVSMAPSQIFQHFPFTGSFQVGRGNMYISSWYLSRIENAPQPTRVTVSTLDLLTQCFYCTRISHSSAFCRAGNMYWARALGPFFFFRHTFHPCAPSYRTDP